MTLTPIVRTSSGSVGSAMATRFCTSTWAMFTLVPSSKVTSSVYEPSLLLCDDMYSMPSTPTTCCSIGAATVSATTWALAPGYLAVTWTVGGVISGYSATGRRAAAMAPSRMMTMEITQARTGRSMKKRASMAVLPQGKCKTRDSTKLTTKSQRSQRKPADCKSTIPHFFASLGVLCAFVVNLFRIWCFGLRILAGHVYQVWLHGDARAHLLQAVDDHPFARFQPVLTRPQAVVERPHPDGRSARLVLLVDAVPALLPLSAIPYTSSAPQPP